MTGRTEGALRHLKEELAQLEAAGRLRKRPPPIDGEGSRELNLCSNDYLGYRSEGRLIPAARAAFSEHAAGAGASRLVCGEHRAHAALEEAIATWVGSEDAIVFTSGYAANVGLVSSLAGDGDLVVSDALNHASIVDGCRLSRAKVQVVPHLEVSAVQAALSASQARRRWVITESYFSMDGDAADLAALRTVCDRYDAALVVDESHAMGVFGPGGVGHAVGRGVRPDVLMGTLGKALGAQGAFVAGSRELCQWLWNRARSFVFSTGLSPLLAQVGVQAVKLARADEPSRERLAKVGWLLREGLRSGGVNVLSSDGPILPIVVGQETAAMEWSRRLLSRGVWVQAIRPPTVPVGMSRLRLTARATLTDDEVARVVEAFVAARGA